MRKFLFLFAFAAIVALASVSSTPAADPPKNKRLLLVTSSGGFIHDSVGFAEETLKDIGPKNGFEVTCWALHRRPRQESERQKW